MKVLGIGAAGVGAMAASAPVFHDLDELNSSGSDNPASYAGGAKFPWWVKKRPHYDPTTEVDWDLKERLDYRHDGLAYTPETEDLAVKTRIRLIYEYMSTNVPGHSIKDAAFSSASGTSAGSPPLAGNTWRGFNTSGRILSDFVVNDRTITPTMASRGMTREILGLPAKHEGTPEDNLNMIRRVSSFFGVPIAGALEMTPQLRKMPYRSLGTINPPVARQIVWDEELGETVTQPYQTDTHTVLPRSLRWVLVGQIPHSGIHRHGTTLLANGGPLSYADAWLYEQRMSTFIAGLGYNQACGPFVSNPGMGILAGLGELGRHDYLVSPLLGSNVRYSIYIFTDLPLAPTPPIDAGIWRFCHTCKKCAETCPGEAISHESKPTWEKSGPWTGLGNNSWHHKYDLCMPWRGQPGGNLPGSCQVCMGACVFTKKPNASIHEIIKATQATTGAFNGFFRVMDDFFGYGEKVGPESFWDMNKIASHPWNGYGACIQ